MQHPLIEQLEEELKTTLASMPIEEIRRLVATGLVFEKNVNFYVSGRDREVEEKAWELYAEMAAGGSDLTDVEGYLIQAYQAAEAYVDDREARRNKRRLPQLKKT